LYITVFYNHLKMKICVLGAGVGGLTCAHELSKHGHEVTVVERNSIVGGLARTMFVEGDYYEYCWKAIGQGYIHLASILDEIPFEDGKSVLTNLNGMGQYIYARENDHVVDERGRETFAGTFGLWNMIKSVMQLDTKLTLRDYLHIVSFYFFIKTSTPERFYEYQETKWEKFNQGFSKDIQVWTSYIASTFLGMDHALVNASTLLNVVRSAKPFPKLTSNHYFCFNGPMHRKWFGPWVKHLESKGVKFVLDTNVESIDCVGDKIQQVMVVDKAGNKSQLVADVFVNAMSVESIAETLRGCDPLQQNLRELAIRGNQLQVQVSFMLDKEIDTVAPTILLLPDSPWGLMTRLENSLWSKTESFTERPGDKIYDILGVGLSVSDVPGILYKKPMCECTREEVIAEAWAQSISSFGLNNYLKTRDGTLLKDLKYVKVTMWQTHQYNAESGQFASSEPKFSNNVGTWNVRPPTADDHITNLVHATGYTKTEMPVYCMEAAAEAGIRAAHYINFKNTEHSTSRYVPVGWFWRACNTVDYALWKCGIPNVFQLLFPH